jgi:hypothetical protein
MTWRAEVGQENEREEIAIQQLAAQSVATNLVEASFTPIAFTRERADVTSSAVTALPTGLDNTTSLMYVPPLASLIEHMSPRIDKKAREIFVNTFDAEQRTILHKQCPPLDDAAKTYTSLCAIVGYCVHQGPGVRIAAFEAEMARRLRVFFKPKTQLRKALASAMIVLKLTSHAEGEDNEEHFLHVVRVNLTTFAMTWGLWFRDVDAERDGIHDCTQGTPLTMTAKPEWTGHWRWLQHQDFTRVWHIQVACTCATHRS